MSRTAACQQCGAPLSPTTAGGSPVRCLHCGSGHSLEPPKQGPGDAFPVHVVLEHRVHSPAGPDLLRIGHLHARLSAICARIDLEHARLARWTVVRKAIVIVALVGLAVFASGWCRIPGENWTERSVPPDAYERFLQVALAAASPDGSVAAQLDRGDKQRDVTIPSTGFATRGSAEEKAYIAALVGTLSDSGRLQLGVTATTGWVIYDIHDRSELQRAGLQDGDVIRSFNGSPLPDMTLTEHSWPGYPAGNHDLKLAGAALMLLAFGLRRLRRSSLVRLRQEEHSLERELGTAKARTT